MAIRRGRRPRLRLLEQGDMVVFYAGLKRRDSSSPSSLYLIGYFEIVMAGMADDFREGDIWRFFGANFHVKHPSIFAEQRSRLVLVKGGSGSRLLRQAVQISSLARDRSGKPLKVLSEPMQAIFGDFGGRISIQRSSPRWIAPARTMRVAEYVRSLI